MRWPVGGATVRLFDVGGRGDEVPQDRVLTVPNLLSLLRLLALPLILVDLLGGRLGRALVLLVVVSSTDWLDGYLARRLDQVSRLGTLLDPAIDRVLFIVVGTGLLVAGLLPAWALVLIVARDVLLLASGAWIAARGRAVPPTSRLGKAATMGLMLSLPFLLVPPLIDDRATGAIVRSLGLAGVAVNLALAYGAALGYARVILSSRE